LNAMYIYNIQIDITHSYYDLCNQAAIFDNRTLLQVLT